MSLLPKDPIRQGRVGGDAFINVHLEAAQHDDHEAADVGEGH